MIKSVYKTKNLVNDYCRLGLNIKTEYLIQLLYNTTSIRDPGLLGL